MITIWYSGADKISKEVKIDPRPLCLWTDYRRIPDRVARKKPAKKIQHNSFDLIYKQQINLHILDTDEEIHMLENIGTT